MEEKIWLAFLAGTTNDKVFDTDTPIRQYIGAFSGSLQNVQAHLAKVYGATSKKIVLKDVETEFVNLRVPYEGVDALSINVLRLQPDVRWALRKAKRLQLGDLTGKSFDDFCKTGALGKKGISDINAQREDFVYRHQLLNEERRNGRKNPRATKTVVDLAAGSSLPLVWPVHCGSISRRERNAKAKYETFTEEEKQSLRPYFRNFRVLTDMVYKLDFEKRKAQKEKEKETE